MAQRSSLRASDEDRERIADRLRHATAEGRLHAHELEERLAKALRARTYGELDDVVSDLPADRVVRRQRDAAADWVQPAVAVAIVVPLAVVAVAVVLAMALFVLSGLFAVWMLWMVIGWWMFGHRARHYRRRHRRRGGPPAGIGGPRQFQRF
jgi:Flp pilus assembly protein TadB